MTHLIRQLSVVAWLAFVVSCTCEVSLGSPGADEKAQQPVTTQKASAIDPGQLAAAVAAPPLAAPPAAARPRPDPTGVLSEASVRKTESRHHNELRFCFENAEPGSDSARVRVQFTVNDDGSVDEQVDVLERERASEKLARCLVQALKRWKFEAPKGGPARATLLLKR